MVSKRGEYNQFSACVGLPLVGSFITYVSLLLLEVQKEGWKGVAAAAVRGESGVPSANVCAGAAPPVTFITLRRATASWSTRLGETPYTSSVRNGSTVRLLARAKAVCI